jgi:hypothetical protein
VLSQHLRGEARQIELQEFSGGLVAPGDGVKSAKQVLYFVLLDDYTNTGQCVTVIVNVEGSKQAGYLLWAELMPATERFFAAHGSATLWCALETNTGFLPVL